MSNELLAGSDRAGQIQLSANPQVPNLCMFEFQNRVQLCGIPRGNKGGDSGLTIYALGRYLDLLTDKEACDGLPKDKNGKA